MQKFIHPLTSEWEKLIERPTASYDDLKDSVLEVFKQVQNRGDEAVLEYTKQFDKIIFSSDSNKYYNILKFSIR